MHRKSRKSGIVTESSRDESDMKKNNQIRNSGLLMITSMIWGAAFVAQSMGMDYVGPATFLFARSVIGTLALVPVALVTGRIQKKKEEENQGLSNDQDPVIREGAWKRSLRNPLLIRGGLICGFFLFAASIFQQVGIQYTTAGKAGFITALYIMIVPIIGIFLGKKNGIRVWIAMVMGIIGLYFLCIRESLSIGQGDILMVVCAFLFSVQILSVDYYSPKVDGIRLSMLEFFFESIFAGVLMVMTETPRLADMKAAAGPILYAGLFSTGIGYTLQIIGQRDLNPAIASLIMSLESVFSLVFGFIILHESMTGRECVGCLIMFAAILVAQLPAPGRQKMEEAAMTEVDRYDL